jgi:hypothetical protein
MPIEWGPVLGRLAPYWVAVASTLWILAFLYVWTDDIIFDVYHNGVIVPVRTARVPVLLLLLLSGVRPVAGLS